MTNIQSLNKRKKNVLKKIVEEYIKKAKPISSGFLAKKDFPQLSSATVRNEMFDLAKRGFLFQPHTSAGKIPTIQAFKFFLANFLSEKEISDRIKKRFLEIKNKISESRKKIKELAKELARQTKGAVIVAFDKDDYFYTGLSYLFSQPEFNNISFVHNLSEVIDHLDRVMSNIFDQIKGREIFIGEDSPFGDKCGAIFDRLEIDDKKIILGLLGPLRMDYNKNLSLMNLLKKIL
ncbi:MAG: hypothetical protein N2259_02650 [Patescibacteria group bacterium]|nr:hypothetical protein [Patescibacteria group bacterium]